VGDKAASDTVEFATIPHGDRYGTERNIGIKWRCSHWRRLQCLYVRAVCRPERFVRKDMLPAERIKHYSTWEAES